MFTATNRAIPEWLFRATVPFAAALVGATIGAAGAAPAAGDVYIYRVDNGYNREVRGKIEYRVDKVDAGRVLMSVATDTPSAGAARTEIYASDGNWLRHPVVNHDQLVDYEFAPAYPAYEFPLDAGKSWSVRVKGTNPATGHRVSVRVDGEVLGTERVTVPAGSYDTIKVKRRVYAGDFEAFRQETTITEVDWFAPALGRVVRAESTSGYMDPSRCGDMNMACTPIRGDWNVFELIEARAARP